MNWVFGISITIGISILMWLVAVGIGLGAHIAGVPLDASKAIVTGASWAMIIAVSGWAVWDSQKIEIRKYESAFSGHPALFFLCCLLLFAIVFACYLSERYKITHGTAKLKAVT